MNNGIPVVVFPLWVVGIVARIVSSLFPSPKYNQAIVYAGEFVAGRGDSPGTLVSCYWKVVKGDIVRRRRKSVNVEGTNHDRTVSRLKTYILYPKTEEAEVDIHTGSVVRIRLRRNQNGSRRDAYRARLVV